MTKFKVGDKVQVVEPGRTYTTYDHMFKKLGFNNTEKNECFEKGLVGEVFVVCDHDATGLPLVGLTAQDGRQCLISVEGVAKIVLQSSSDDEFDIIRQFCDEVLGSEDIEDRVIFKYLLNRSCK
tara:strand:- start:201 stop:572 length:372 start_codon:yes stop_codon:yes gene_type:complete